MKRFLTLLLLVCGIVAAHATDNKASFQVVPVPDKVVLDSTKSFVMDASTVITYPADNEALKGDAAFLQTYVQQLCGIQMTTSTGKAKKAIRLAIDKLIPNDEAYRIRITKKEIVISGKTAAGVFYGIQTLRKALPVNTCSEVEFPLGLVEASPRFKYRGMLLDCARHFFSADFVKQFIDLLALHGMNVFHWHLTDDQGWRIEVKRYPELTKTGAWREETVIGTNSLVFDGTPYGGYYTQEQIKDIVAYAAARHITVIPEIDMPGHTMSVLASIPELGCTGGPYKVGQKWGVYENLLCVANEKVYQFVENVLSEVMPLFPAKIIHIGGDEAPTTSWEHCAKCQALNLKGEGYQEYFTNRVMKIIEKHGWRAICWDESLTPNIPKDVIIMSWRGSGPGFKAAQMGHDVILTPYDYCYFDYYQTKDNGYEPSKMGGYPITVEKVYDAHPIPDTLSVEAKKHFIGLQGNVWTEYIYNPKNVEYMVLPRMAALSAVQWCNTDKDTQGFRTRLTRLSKIYDHYGWLYAPYFWPEKVPQKRWIVR